MKKTYIMILCALFLFGCSNTVVGEFATVNKVNKNSIIITNGSGKTTEININSPIDVALEEQKEYFFKYEIIKNEKATLTSVESIDD